MMQESKATMSRVSKPEKMIVRLTELRSDGRGVSVEGAVFLHPEGSVCKVGTGKNADLQLPRAQFLALAQRHFGVVRVGGRISIEIYHPELTVRVDGKSAEGAAIALGAHDLEIGPHRFRLELADA